MPFHRPVRRRHRMPGLLLKRFMQGFFRFLFRLQRWRTAEAGFVFPTTVLLVLMVTLTAGALTYRAYSRGNQVLLERQQQVITNAATPAVDRAKAKLEYLFNRDDRPKPVVPPSDAIENLLRATGDYILTDADGGFSGEYDRLAIQELDDDIYTLGDEERIDLNGDGKPDNAWLFPADVNGDGEVTDSEVIVYSILVDHLNNNLSFDEDDATKAANLVARNSPLTADVNDPCVREEEEETVAEEPISGEGWSRVGTLKAEKTFQVDVFATDLSDRNVEDVVSTLEFQQIREASLGNKWGAWFRYDLEASPGEEFNWNGAMHTQGSLFMANDFNAYMISSTASCAYDDGASELTLGAERTLDDGEQFRGQIVLGNADIGFGNGDNLGPPTIHVEDDDDLENPRIVNLNDNTDTVDDGGASISEIYLDPIALHLRDESRHVDPQTASAWDQTRDLSEPAQNPFGGRVRNVRDTELVNISLDDTYRADDRNGPRAIGLNTGLDIGEDLPADEQAADGYWERQAVTSGTRLGVGQRLELGNINGWNYDPRTDTTVGNSDPLYPPTELPGVRTGEHYQRKSLRENLAAVQGMVVYHYETGGGREPLVCIATTAHHGTYQTIANSRTFRKLHDETADDQIMVNFLTGNGTNGWQFAPVTSLSTSGENALENMANFAGDEAGGAPSFTPVQDNEVHPYPYLSMWGDYSTLRRVEEGEGNGSIADQSTVDTASCTLSLLAYNLKAISDEYDSYDSADWQALASDLTNVVSSNASILEDLDIGAGNVQTPLPFRIWLQDLVAIPGFTGEQRILAETAANYWGVEYSRAFGFANLYGLPSANTQSLGGTYDPVAGTYQTSAGISSPYAASTLYNVGCDPNVFTQGNHGIPATDEADALSLALALCPSKLVQPQWPALFYIFPMAGHNTNPGGNLVLGEDYAGGVPSASQTYSFTNDIIIVRDEDGNLQQLAFDEEDYVNEIVSELGEDSSFTAVSYADIVNIAATPLAPANWVIPVNTGITAKQESFEPTSPTTSFVGDETPVWDDDDGNSPDADDREWDLVILDDAGEFESVVSAPILDKVIYSGRENMAIRLLDINVFTLMQENNVADTWFAGQDAAGNEHFGLTYAFREDAVREDSIVRPTDGTFGGCDDYETYATYSSGNDNCYMKTDSDVTEWTDPPLSDADSLLSLKPVDYVPDPMRKPYGFRLRNGANFGREEDVASGLSFISDNVVAIQGDFNLHTQADPDDIEEEFTNPTVFDKDPSDGDTKGDFYNAFYGRAAVDANDVFADSTRDDWRPSEVLGDAVYLFSNSFKDGFVEAGYASDAAGVTGGDNGVFQNNGSGLVSFENMNRLSDETDEPDGEVPTASDFLREDPNAPLRIDENGILVADVAESPIYFDRNGHVYFGTEQVDDYGGAEGVDDVGGDDFEYFPFNVPSSARNNDAKNYRTANLPRATDTTINALIFSGIVPSREGQTYGGLHNFPRLNEYWSSAVNLQIAGGFFQLNFSNSSTGPYDMEVWEYNDDAPSQTRNNINHYLAPNRVWGYDVALQYAQQPPIAARFVSLGTPRSEFYRELPVDDAYINMLRCAELNGAQIDPTATCGQNG